MFFIVVDSSTANRKLLRCMNACKYFLTFAVAKASTLTSSILNLSLVLTPSSNTIFSLLFAPDFHTYTLFGTSSGKCVGISEFFQFIYTPFGAIIMAVSMCLFSYNQVMLSIKTFDLPQPISIK